MGDAILQTMVGLPAWITALFLIIYYGQLKGNVTYKFIFNVSKYYKVILPIYITFINFICIVNLFPS